VFWFYINCNCWNVCLDGSGSENQHRGYRRNLGRASVAPDLGDIAWRVPVNGAGLARFDRRVHHVSNIQSGIQSSVNATPRGLNQLMEHHSPHQSTEFHGEFSGSAKKQRRGD
jgi:hypothetical protein